MQKLLLVIGGKYHNFESCGQILKDYLESTGLYSVEMTDDWKRVRRLKDIDAVLLYTVKEKITKAQEEGLLSYVREGGAVVAIHCANVWFNENQGYLDMIGTHFVRHGPIAQFDVEMASGADEVVPRMAPGCSVVDEFYESEKVTDGRLRPIMYGNWQFQKLLMSYVRTYGKGRVFYTALGHDERTFYHPEFQNLIVKAIRYVTKQKEEKIRVGLLGYGPAYGMGGHHSGRIADTTGFELKAVCDRDKGRLDAAQEEQGGELLTFTDAKQMAQSGEIDLGVCILPHNLHCWGIKTLLDAGLHVITEKPFAVKASECDELIALAQEKGVMLSVYHNRHWDPDILTILEVVKAGTIGELFSIECNMTGFRRPGQAWRSHKPVSGGAAYDMGAHQFEKIFQIVPMADGCGKPINRKAKLYGSYQKRRWHDTTNEDFVRAYVRFDSGLEAQLMVSNLCAAPKPLWSVLGTEGSLVMDSWQSPVKVFTPAADGRILTTEVPAASGPWNPYYRNVADHLLCGLPLLITAQVGRRPIQCIEGCEIASKEDRIVEVEFE